VSSFTEITQPAVHRGCIIQITDFSAGILTAKNLAANLVSWFSLVKNSAVDSAIISSLGVCYMWCTSEYVAEDYCCELLFVAVPDEFNYDPVSKTYGEPQRRPEIRSSTIEFIAPSEYMVRNYVNKCIAI